MRPVSTVASVLLAALVLAAPSATTACPGPKTPWLSPETSSAHVIVRKPDRIVIEWTTRAGPQAVKDMRSFLMTRVRAYEAGKDPCATCGHALGYPFRVRGLKLGAKEVKHGLRLEARGPAATMKQLIAVVDRSFSGGRWLVKGPKGCGDGVRCGAAGPGSCGAQSGGGSMPCNAKAGGESCGAKATDVFDLEAAGGMGCGALAAPAAAGAAAGGK